MPDNKDLLQQLRLDKTSAPPPNIHFGWWLAAAVVTVGLGLWWFMLPRSPTEVPRPEAPNTTKSQPAAVSAPASPIAGNVAGKILDASGYITARQMATVSAEVMGLILSVDVEEGMKVEQGQVLAQLDDTQARINLDLAKTRVRTQDALLQSLRVDYAEAARELRDEINRYR